MISKPTPRQLEYQDWELGVFAHFGIRTFYEGHRDWDGKEGEMKAEAFNPSALDCRQWARTAKSGGARYMVFTAKHHDGFANWPSRLTDFSVAHSPWKNGKGDVVREYVNACREYGLKVGLYYSPADATSPHYGDPKAYDDYFIAQVGELLGGEYGAIDMLWFDGCGSENHAYDWARITKEIRRMQPAILLFSMGDPDYRWVGNEAGLAQSPQWNTVDEFAFSVRTEKRLSLPGSKNWLPVECDFMMRDCNWFYSEHDEGTVKSPRELLGNYYYSVGRGANMLVNIGPDRRGLFPQKDSDSLTAMGAEVGRRFKKPIFSRTDFKREGDVWTMEIPGYGRHGNVIGGTCLIDHAVLCEELGEGEHVQRFQICILPYINGKEPIVVYEGTSVGHKAICSFPPVRCRGVLVRVIEKNGPVDFRSVDIFDTSEKS